MSRDVTPAPRRDDTAEGITVHRHHVPGPKDGTYDAFMTVLHF